MARFLVVAALAAAAAAQNGPAPTSCSGTPNTFPVWTGEPTFVTKMQYGSKYVVQPSANYTAPLNVLHVYGSAYQMGLAYGTLMKTEISTVLPEVVLYMEEQINATIGSLPEPLRTWIETKGLEWALNTTYEVTKPFTPQRFYDTIQGMSDGSGVEFMALVRMSMIPELIKASCSIIGAWGPATANTSTPGALLQLRALDWDTGGPFQKYPLLLTYHPLAGNGSTFTVMTWAGLVGAITGWSSSGMSISEKVWDAYKGLQNVVGYPFHFVLQDILQYDVDIDQALSRIATAQRTCSVWMGIGSGVENSFKVVAYSYQEVNIYNPDNFPTYPNHDHFDSLVFINKHVQPSSEPCMNDLMHWLYGSLDAQNVLQYVTAMEKTGDMHIAIYSHGDSMMYISNASPSTGPGTDDGDDGAIMAYNRQFLRFNMTQLWATSL